MNNKLNHTNKQMKKIILVSALLLAMFTSSSKAALGTANYVLGGLKGTNTVSGPVKIVSVNITADTTNQSILILDSPGTWTTNYEGSYTSYTQYATNQPSSWTNFFGNVNTVTNTVLQTNWSTTAAITNVYPTKFTGAAVSNTTSFFNNVNVVALNGLLVTNPATSGNITVVITYEK
jgi:hypothetical protein